MPSPSTGDDRPNVVFLIADDHRYDVMSCRGNPYLETPNIDQLADDGCLFENGFTTAAVCAPSRGAFLTGKYPHLAGTPRMPWKNNTFLRRERPFPARLGDDGYYAAHVGKWHLGEGHLPKDGYDYWAGFEWLGEFEDPTVHVNGEPQSFEGYADDVLAELAAERIRERGDASNPFCLTFGLKAPHLPFAYPERYDDTLEDVDIPRPPSFDEDYGQTKKEPLQGNTIDIETFRGGLPLFDGDWDDYIRSYYRAVLAIDDAVGRVVQALEDAGIADKTILIYTSDHGYTHGEHGLTEKHYAYEESMRIPMLVRYPPLTGEGGHRPTEMALNIDIAPTLHDLCGVDTDEEMDGRSLRPLLDGKTDRPTDWREEWLFLFEDDRDDLPAQLAVRTDRYKLVTYQYHDHEELYDLREDPHELRNVIDESDYADVRDDLEGRLDRLCAETDYVPRTETPVSASYVLGPVHEVDAESVRERLFANGYPALEIAVEVGSLEMEWTRIESDDGEFDLTRGFDVDSPSLVDTVCFVAIPLRRMDDRDPFVEMRFSPFRRGRAYADGEVVWTFDDNKGGATYNPPLDNELTVAVLEFHLTADDDGFLSATFVHPEGRVDIGR